MSVKERFLRYVKIDTQSSESSGEHPSTKKQFNLAHLLVEELKNMGVKDVYLDEEHCYVYASISENEKSLPSIGFIAHMDTEPVCSGENVQPQSIVYQGGDILLKNGKIISTKEFPVLKNYIGQEIITTSGDTLLGADDKAGVAEIMTAANYILSHPEIKHGKIGIAFTPDEEIGEGPLFFDVKGFNCDYAYTIDGEELGELGYETFNAAEAVITFTGKNIHPGSAKGKMINCSLIAADFMNNLPKNEIPAKTELREGFYHITSVNTEVEKGEIKLIIRDHDEMKFEQRKLYIENLCKKLKIEYGENSVKVEIRDQYKNCLEKIREHFHLIENARIAIRDVNVEPIETPVRGGTDGCTLSFMGLPCPNLFTGGMNAHSVLEYIPVPSMEKAVEVIINLIKIYGKK